MDSNLVIENEPIEVTEARHKILETFKELEFVEEGHHYYLNGKEIPSVSSVIHQFEPYTDFEKIAVEHAEKHGFTKEYWQDKWKFNNLMATITGTLVHAYGESLGWMMNGHPELITDECKCKFVKEKQWLIPTRKKEEAVAKFLNDLPKSYHLVLNEAKVFSGLNVNEELNPKHQYCGTFDMLYYYDGEGNKDKSGFVIFDYKTNKELEKEYNRKNLKMLEEPFINFYNEPKSIYTLQLSAYQIPLEDIGLKVLGRRLIWLKDDGTYEKISVQDVTSTLRETL